MPAIPVEVKHVDEPWINIQLADGSTIKMRVIIFGVDAVYDDNGNHQIMPDGELAYGVKHAFVFNTKSSPHVLEAAKKAMQQQAKGKSN